MLRTHGWKKKYYSEEVGYNSRLDALQAAILQAKLPHVDAWNDRRRELAARYSEQLSALGLAVPIEHPWGVHVFHLYIIRSGQRDAMQAFLKGKGIASEVYYPLPLHLSTPCRMVGYLEGDFPHAELASREAVALPLFPELTETQQDHVICAIQDFLS
jgi:dTDP-4-amino-4,6-dideoxygalactose transaminase